MSLSNGIRAGNVAGNKILRAIYSFFHLKQGAENEIRNRA